MLDVKYIRENREIVENGIRTRNVSEKIDYPKLLSLLDEKNTLLPKVESMRNERNKHASEISKAGAEEREEKIKKATELKAELSELEAKYKEIDLEIEKLLPWIPNIPLEEVPVGKGEKDNIEIKAWSPHKGYLQEGEYGGLDKSREYMPLKPANSSGDFEPIPHWEIAKELDILDLEAGSKVSGSRFYYIKNEGVIMMYAIFDLLMRKLLSEGFSPMIVPLLVKNAVLYGSSQFPADEKDIYRIDNFNVEDDKQLYLVGSSEPPLFAYYADEVIQKEKLPVKMMAISTCFRSEAGSWGKDVRGMKRTHQFDKLEMDMIVENDLDKARQYHEYLLSFNEWLLQSLKLPYHVINMCTGDLGYYAAAKKYDLEVWLSTSKEYMETMSDSITTDYQSRRLNIKYNDGDKNKLVYTLNDTGATHRLLIAIIEHYQQKDGSVVVPEVLRNYTGFDVIKKK